MADDQSGFLDISKFLVPEPSKALSWDDLGATARKATGMTPAPTYLDISEFLVPEHNAVTRGFVSTLLKQNPEAMAETLEAWSILSGKDTPEAETQKQFARNTLPFGVGTAAGVADDALDRVANWGADSASSWFRKIAASAPKEFEPTGARILRSQNVDEALTGVGELFGSGMGSVLPTLVTGGAGAAIGGRVAGGLGAAVGGVAGAALSSAPLNYGSLYRALKDEGIDPKRAAEIAVIPGIMISALDTASGAKLIEGLGGKVAKDAIIKGMAQRIAVAAAKGAGIEGITEAAQQAIQEATASLETGKPFFTAERGERIAEAGIAGTLAGGPIGGVGGMVQRRAPVTPFPHTPGERERAATTVPELTPADDASPIPNDTIAAGKQAIATAKARQTANSALKKVGLPEVGTEIELTNAAGQPVRVTIEDTFAGRPADAHPRYDFENSDLQVGWIDTKTGTPYPLNAPVDKPGVNLKTPEGRILSVAFDDLQGMNIRVMPKAPVKAAEVPATPPARVVEPVAAPVPSVTAPEAVAAPLVPPAMPSAAAPAVSFEPGRFIGQPVTIEPTAPLAQPAVPPARAAPELRAPLAPPIEARPAAPIEPVSRETIAPIESTPAAALPVAMPEPITRIEDAGEKIGGARKDLWANRGLQVSDLETMTPGEAHQYVTKEQVWGPEDYAARAAEGVDPMALALTKVIKNRLAASPAGDSAEARAAYVTMMGQVRDAFANVKTVEDVEGVRTRLLTDMGIDLNTAWRNTEAKQKLLTISTKGHNALYVGNNDRIKARALVEKGFPGEIAPWKRRFRVTQSFDETWAVLAGERGSHKQLVYGLPSKEAAEMAAVELYEKSKPSQREGPPVRPHLDKIEREGPDVRAGRDVDGQTLVDELKFRGVEFGNWAAGDERQKAVNHAYDALHDLARTINVEPAALSLDGSMGLAFGARGKGRAMAHYEPGKLVINLTKMSGAGSLAHEWGHALDHYFGELGQPETTRGSPKGASGWRDRTANRIGPLQNLRPEMADAFDKVMNAIFKRDTTRAEDVRVLEQRIEKAQANRARATAILADEKKLASTANIKQWRKYAADLDAAILQSGKRLADLTNEARPHKANQVPTEFYKAAEGISKSGAKSYWTRPTELFARAFESYVHDKIAAGGGKSQYLVHSVEKPPAYPTGLDRAHINEAFDSLFATMKVRPGAKGPALFSVAEAVSAPQPASQLIKIATGERFNSQSGRELAPAPKIGATTDAKAGNTRRRVDAWLLDEAQKEAKATGNEHVSTLLAGLNPKRLSAADRTLVNDVVFGGEGPTEAHRVGAASKPKAPSFTAPEEKAPLAERPTRAGMEYSPEFQGARKKVAAAARQRLDDLGLPKIGIRIADKINMLGAEGKHLGDASGVYLDRTITLALADNWRSVLDHEAVHALRGLGVFTDTEWRLLTARAKSEWRAKYNIDKRYEGMNEEVLNEEAIAEAFRHWPKTEVKRTVIGRLVNLVSNTLSAIRSALQGHGFQTADDIFRDIESGKVGAREPKYGYSAREPQFSIDEEGAKREKSASDADRILINKHLAPSDAGPIARAAKTQFWREAARDGKQATFVTQAISSLNSIFELEKRGNKGALRDASVSAAKMAELAQADPARLWNMFHTGAMRYVKALGHFEPVKGSKGLIKIFQYLSNPDVYDRFRFYAAARRGSRLIEEGRERNLTPEAIERGLAMANEKGKYRGATRTFEQIFDDFQKFNKENLEGMGVETGLLTQEQVDLWTEHSDYIPFYRHMEETGQFPDAPTMRKMINNPDPGIKTLKGGSSRVGDLLENIVRNVSALNSAGLHNVTMRRIFNIADELGETRLVTKGGVDDGVLTYRVNGNEVKFRVEDPSLVTAVASMRPEQLAALERAAITVTGIFRNAITSHPFFWLANLWRGEVASWVQTGKNISLTNNVVTSLYYVLTNAETVAKVRAISGTGTYRFGGDVVEKGRHLRRQIGAQRELMPVNLVHKIWHAVEVIGEATELAARVSIYREVIKAGGTEAQAGYEALNLINYTRRGASKSLRRILPNIPFLNARIQGLYRMLETQKSGADKRRILAGIAVRGLILTAGHLLLREFTKDDPRYDDEPMHRKSMYHIVYTKDGRILLPKAFEFGTVFATIPELVLDAVDDKNGKRLGTGLSIALLSTFGFNPIPQPFKPIIELATNTNTFTMRPIESQYMQRLRPGERAHPTTSPTLKAIGGATNISPLVMEHLIRGYTATLGMTLLSGIDALGEAAGLYPDRPASADAEDDIMAQLSADLLGRFYKKGEDPSNRWVQELYDMNDKIHQIVNHIQTLAEEGNAPVAQRLYEQNKTLVDAGKAVESVLRSQAKEAISLSKINAAIRYVQNDKAMTAFQKRMAIQPLIKLRNDIAEEVVKGVTSEERRAREEATP